MTRKQIRPTLIPDAQPVREPDCCHQQNRLALTLEQGVSRDSRPDFHRVNTAVRNVATLPNESARYVQIGRRCDTPLRPATLSRRRPQYLPRRTNPRIPTVGRARLHRQHLADVQLPRRRQPDDVREGAPSIYPELPTSHVFPLAHF